MKQLKNEVLNTIYQSFIEKNGFKRNTKSNKILKYVPILNMFNLLSYNSGGYARFSISGYWVSVQCMIFLYIKNILIDGKTWNECEIAFVTIFLIFFTSYAIGVCFYKEELTKKEEFENILAGNISLSAEDFNTIVSTLNKEIVGKFISDSNGKMNYNDLKELDRLLLREY